MKRLNFEELQLAQNIREQLKRARNKLLVTGLILLSISTLAACSDEIDENSSENISEDPVVEVESNDSEGNEENKENDQDEVQTESEENREEDKDLAQENSEFSDNRLIEVDGSDQSGSREANVVVDIGFGDREYYAYTNEHGQLVKVTAKEIILQDHDTEPVLSSGRYYYDEAKVPGVESSTLDEGHVIADSLGGVSNAYNITPQNSTMNRHGDQAYMEKVIRDAGGCTDFVAIITYPNTETQIPSRYKYTYTLKGNRITDEFDNVNPDEVNAQLESQQQQQEPVKATSNGLAITQLDKKAEYVVIKNSGSSAINLSGYKIVSVRGNQSFTFPSHSLAPNTFVKVGDSDKNSDIDYHWLDGRGTWNNSKSDPAELYNSKGELVSEFGD